MTDNHEPSADADGSTAAVDDEPRADADSAAERADRRLPRRRVVAAGAAALTAGVAGCAGSAGGGTETPTPTATDSGDGEASGGGPSLPAVEDPPDAVYVPTHFEAMRHLEPVRAGAFELLPMVTYPHRFWTVTGEDVEPAVPSGDHVHLMVSVRDPETGTVLPAGTGLELQVGPVGEPGSVHAPWPMLSQEMGFHFGDNVPLGEDGTYEVAVRVGAVDAALTGAFAGRFDEPGEATFTFEFDQEFRNEVVGDIEYVDEEYWGARGALANHVAGMHRDGGGDADAAGAPPHGREQWSEGEGRHRFGTYGRDPAATELPPASELPGTLQGTPLSGDAVLATTLLPGGSRFVDGDARYLAVSPRTPYNRGTLPMTNLAFEQVRDGETLASGDLRATLDPELGYHYGAPLGDVADGDDLTVRVETPPQAARHAGYETAFREMPPVTLALEVP